MVYCHIKHTSQHPDYQFKIILFVFIYCQNYLTELVSFDHLLHRINQAILLPIETYFIKIFFFITDYNLTLLKIKVVYLKGWFSI